MSVITTCIITTLLTIIIIIIIIHVHHCLKVPFGKTSNTRSAKELFQQVNMHFDFFQELRSQNSNYKLGLSASVRS